MGSRFYEIMESIGDVVILSFLWTLCSLPIVTIGTSSSALYYAIHKNLTEESSHCVKDFFHSYKSNFKQCTVLSFIGILYTAVAVFNSYVGYNGWNGITLPEWYFPVSFVLFIPVLFITPYLFPYLARFSDTSGKVLKNSFTFGSIHLLNSIEIILMMAAAVASFIVFPPALLFVPYIVCRVTHFLTEKAFSTVLMLMDKRAHPEKYATEEDSDDDDSDDENDEDIDYDDEDLEEDEDENDDEDADNTSDDGE